MLGAGPDAPHPGLHRGGAAKARGCNLRRFRADARAFCDILHALVDGHTVLSLVDISGLDRMTTYRLIDYMKALKLIHVFDWERRFSGGGEPMKMYKLGRRRDAPKPPPMGHALACRLYRERSNERAPLASALTHLTMPLAQASL